MKIEAVNGAPAATEAPNDGMLGAAADLVETVGGLRQFKPSVITSVQLLLGNRYALLPGSGAPVLQIEGVTTYIALTPQQYVAATGSNPPAGFPSAWEAIQQRNPPSAYALVDSDSVNQQLQSGGDVPIVLYIAATKDLAAQLSLGSTAAVVAPLSGQPGASTTPTKKSAGATPLVSGVAIGGATFFATGNPVIALGAGLVGGVVANALAT